MSKITKDDLTMKSKAQLVAIFTVASRGLATACSDLASKQSLLELVRAEIAKRRHSP